VSRAHRLARQVALGQLAAQNQRAARRREKLQLLAAIDEAERILQGRLVELRAEADAAARRGAELLAEFERDCPELAGRRTECRALGQLRRTGWRPTPSGEWRSPGGLAVPFERAVAITSRERQSHA